MTLSILTSLGVLFSIASLSFAQTSANLPVQPIGPNDLLSLTVYDAPELSGTLRVSPQGTISVAMLQKPLNARGLLPTALETTIAEALKNEQLIKRPMVTVRVLEYQSRPVVVSGAVKRPLTFQAVGGVTLLEAIARAEGLSSDAGPAILVTMPGSAEVKRIAVEALMAGNDPRSDITLVGGEHVRVPERGRVYVVGNVRRPGAIPAVDASVLKSLALTEGLAPNASKEAFIYRRSDGSDGRAEIPVDLKRLLKRESPDVPLREDDIFYIPENGKRRLALAALEKALAFGTTAGATAMIYRGVR
jgi:polysaccharide export outer membrane protein